MDDVRPDVAIRPASDGDIDALASLSTQLGYPSSADAMRKRFNRVRQRNIGEVFVAVDPESRVVGWTHVVDESARGVGVGAALLRAAESWAREQGHDRLRVRSNVMRERAHRFYEREGYAERKRQIVFDKPLTKF